MILCIGTTPVLQRTMVFDRLTLDAVNRATEVTVSTGGKALNVAKALRTLGTHPLASGFVGGGSGRVIRQLLDDAGIAHDFVDVPCETRTCVTIIDCGAAGATELIEEPRRVAEEYWRTLIDKYDALASTALVIVLSGSLPPGASEDFYADCVRRAGQTPVIVDARGEALTRSLVHRPFLVKPNRAELADTLQTTIDSESSLREAMRRLIDRGPRWAVVTLGADGALACDGRNFWRIRIPKVKVVSAIASGDCFAAGLAAGIARRQSMPEVLRLAAACSVANAMTALPAMIRMEDVGAIEKQVQVQVQEC